MTFDSRQLSIPDSDWAQVSLTDATSCSVTLEGTRGRPVVVQIQPTKPDVSAKWGHTLTSSAPFMPINEIKTGSKVWARCLKGTATVVVS